MNVVEIIIRRTLIKKSWYSYDEESSLQGLGYHDYFHRDGVPPHRQNSGDVPIKSSSPNQTSMPPPRGSHQQPNSSRTTSTIRATGQQCYLATGPWGYGYGKSEVLFNFHSPFLFSGKKSEANKQTRLLFEQTEKRRHQSWKLR